MTILQTMRIRAKAGTEAVRCPAAALPAGEGPVFLFEVAEKGWVFESPRDEAHDRRGRPRRTKIIAFSVFIRRGFGRGPGPMVGLAVRPWTLFQ
jgi:hypothetical protein